MPRERPTLPARWAFVVQLHTESRVARGHFTGRVEHLVSHQATHFASLEELLAFMVQMVTQPQNRQPDDPG